MKGTGSAMTRVEGPLKVTGKARYAYEADINGAVFGYIVQTTIAKGEVVEFDTSAAESAPGVLGVLAPKNMPRLMGGFSGDTRHPLGGMNVVYAGQHLAVVIADTPERARHAGSLIKVRYAPIDPLVDMDDPRVPKETPSEGRAGSAVVKRGDVDGALKSEGLTTVEQTYTTPVETHNPMEMHATVAVWEGDDKLTVYDATQGVSATHDALCKAFNLQPENVRVCCPYTGGAFGCKGEQWHHKFLAVAAAKMVGRPVRLMLTRAQMFTSAGHRPQTKQDMTLAATKDGKLVALRHTSHVQGSPTGTHLETCGMGTSAVMYAVPNLDVSHMVHKVDLAPATWMRAPGETPGSFALESALDELALALAMDPVQLRVVNHAAVSPQDGLPWSTNHTLDCYREGAKQFGWAKKQRGMRGKNGELIGWGMATAAYPAMKFPGSARIRIMADGRAIGAAASQDLGTGTWTITRQMLATLLDMPVENVRFDMGDSDLPASGVSGGSTTAASVAQALSQASVALKTSLLEHAAGTPLAELTADKVDFKGGRLVASGGATKGVLLTDLVAKSGQPFVEGATSAPPRQGGGQQRPPATHAFHSFGAHFVEVAIDPSLPRVQVRRVVSVVDVGRIVNPLTARSQIIGGVVMGIGAALLEETVYDERTGRPMTDNLADYHVPLNPDIPKIDVHFIDEPDTLFNAIGCRGIGEIGITGVAAAIANAVYDATGTRIRELPITPDKLL